MPTISLKIAAALLALALYPAAAQEDAAESNQQNGDTAAQEASEEASEGEEASEAGEASESEEAAESGDAESPGEDDDEPGGFEPSEEISDDRSVSFPVDI